MSNRYPFSSESVGEGHPDKVADYISDSILDACLKQDKFSRVACETLVKSNTVTIAGEITTKAKINYDEVIRGAIRDIGYTHDDDVFHADKVFIHNVITAQSSDIAQGVDKKAAAGKANNKQGAGDQGIMFGYACNETPELMPAAIMYSHRILRRLAELRKAKKSPAPWLRPDCKSQVSVIYDDGGIAEITAVVISTQHAADVSNKTIHDFLLNQVVKKVLPAKLLTKNTQYLFNPTGKFVIGGPQGDAGVTGRKIIVDSYGGSARHGGGAFSGKDPSKVDRSAAYMCRYVAKNLVNAGFADRVELQVAYAIGYSEPLSIQVETFGTGKYPQEVLEKAVRKVFRFQPEEIVKQLNLLRPIYRETTHYGHFAKDGLPWEKTDKVKELQAAVSGGKRKSKSK